MHRSLAAYVSALHDAGLLIEVLTEPLPDDDLLRDQPQMARVRRVPWYLHLRAVRRE